MTEEAQRYADYLEWGIRIGVVVLIASFVAYVTGIFPPHIPLDQLPLVWNLPVPRYLAQTGTPTGWAWLSLAYHGDLLGLLGIALLASCSLLPLLALVHWYAKRRDWIYAGLSAAIALVLILAASGVFSGVH